MTEGKSKQEGQEVGVWPGRYIVEGSIEQMTDRGHIYKDVWMKLFRHEMPEGEIRSLLKSIGYTDSVIRGYEQDIISQVEDTFTEEQADQLIAYLKKYKNPEIKAWKKKAEKPKGGYVGTTAIPAGVETGWIQLSEQEGYDLDFKAWAYYDTRRAEYLKPDPSAELEGYLKMTAIDRLKSQIDTDLKYLTQVEIQELKEYLEEKSRSMEDDHDRQ